MFRVWKKVCSLCGRWQSTAAKPLWLTTAWYWLAMHITPLYCSPCQTNKHAIEDHPWQTNLLVFLRIPELSDLECGDFPLLAHQVVMRLASNSTALCQSWNTECVWSLTALIARTGRQRFLTACPNELMTNALTMIFHPWNTEVNIFLVTLSLLMHNPLFWDF